MRNLSKLLFLSWLILIFMLATLAPALAGEKLAPVIFSDVRDGEPNLLFINYLANRGLVKGYADGTFHPAANLTRAEAVTLLTRATGLKNKAAQSPFKDVKSTFWAAGNIIAAQEAGLIKGYSDGTFKPDAKLTRAEGIALLLRISKQPDPKIALPVLQDLSPQHWAAGPAAIGLAAEMVSLSKDNKHFLPNIPMTRREMARALAVLLTKDPELAQAPLINEVKVLRGTTKIIRAGTSFEVTSGLAVVPGDTIMTGSNSEVELIFSDGTGLQIKENTELKIKETKGRAYIKTDGTKGTAVEWLALELKQGKIFGALATPAESTPTKAFASLKDQMLTILKSITAVENKPGLFTTLANKPVSPWWQYNKIKRVKVKVDMPWGVAAIRGTFWENVVNPDGSSKTTLLTGEAELTSGGQTVILKAGEKTEVTSATAAPLPPAPMNPQDKAEWVVAKDWAQERAQAIQDNQEKPLPVPPPAGAPVTPVEEVQPPVSTLPNLIEEAFKGVEQPSSGGGGSSSVAVLGVTLDKTTVSLAYSGGMTINLTATVAPANATNKAVSWSSSDTSIVTVSGTGLTGSLTPVAAGSATITVTTADGGKTTSCTVTVTSLAFQSAVSLNVGTGPLFAGIENFDKAVAYDNNDLVVVKTDEARVLFGDGSGTVFPTGVNLAPGASPQGLIVGDFGLLGGSERDFAIARDTSQDVYVMLGDGLGNFSGYSYSLGASPISIAAGNLDSNYTDMVVTRSVSDVVHDVYLLLGQDDGSFQSGGSYEVGNRPVGIALNNFNGMWDPKDIAVARTVTNDVYILFNDGNGGFGSLAPLSIPLGAAPTSIVSGDFDYDHYADLAVTRSGFNDVYILMSNGDGTFKPGISIPTGSTPGYLAVGNFDNDMGDEIVVTDTDSNTISIINCNDTQYGLLPLVVTGPVKFQVGDSPGYIATGNLGGSYNDDIVVVNYGSGNISILLNNLSN